MQLQLFKFIHMSNENASQKNQVKQVKQSEKQKKQTNTYKFEGLFKWIVIIVSILAIPAFFDVAKFRDHCQRMNIYTANLQYVGIWIVFGFVFNLIAKKLFHILFSSFIRRNFSQKIISKTQNLDEKTLLQTNLLYDTFFHFGISFVSWYYFYQEQWYPSVLGGNGNCPAILSKAFKWPSLSTQIVEAFYGFQIGSIFCHTFQHALLHFKKSMKPPNYNQIWFHHIVTICMESLSLFYNMIDDGIVVMVLHDFSDGIRVLSKLMKQSNLSQTYSKQLKIFDYVYIGVWCTMRVIMLPICCLEALINIDWSIVQEMSYLSYQVNFIIFLLLLIIFLQTYWFYHILSFRAGERNRERQRKEQQKQR